jgi:hypothetical protein
MDMLICGKADGRGCCFNFHFKKKKEEEEGENEADVGFNTFKFIDKIFKRILQRKIPLINLLENNDVSYD